MNMHMKSMDLTEQECEMIMSFRKSNSYKENKRREQSKYPKTYMDQYNVKVVKPWAGNHVGYYVYLDDELMCVCTYKKGAMKIADYMSAVERPLFFENN